MKFSVTIWLFILVIWSCSNKGKKPDFAYIKVLTERSTNSVTKYNKGYTTGTFLYYEPQKDSLLVFYSPSDTLSPEKTFVGKLTEFTAEDSFSNLLRVLHRYGNGDLPLPFDSNSNYDGPYYYVEYQDGNGVHDNAFILANDTLSQFDTFYSHLLDRSLKSGKTDLHLVHGDSEFVKLSKRTEIYQQAETPYIPHPCTPGIDLENLYGVWRDVGDLPYSTERSYNKMIFQRDGVWIWQKIKDGIVEKEQRAKFTTDSKAKTFTLLNRGQTLTHRVINLSKTCLQYEIKDQSITERYDRM